MSASNYSADAALVDPDDDRLQRKPFAHRIADTIASRRDPTSLVVGLYGRWGEGKTTVLNFIEARLRENEEIVPVRFNPWLYQDERQLLMSFFETLAQAIEHRLTSRKEDVGKLLRALGRGLSTVSVAFGPASGAPGAAVEALGGYLSSDDVRRKRERLEQALAEAGKRVVILIDDIDRLDNSEIAMVFKLVKLAADFRHTSYVLSFDREVVAEALATKYAGGEDTGSSFIEKIVQVPLELPRADPEVLQRMTFEEIGKSIAAAGISADDADLSRFSMVFYRNIAKYIQTPRTAKRLANAIDFAVPLVASEVNLADLLILECVRGLLFPSAYKRIPLFKDCLLGRPFDYGMGGHEATEYVRTKLDELLTGLDGTIRDDVTAALRDLFPRIERLFTNYHYGLESIPGWRSEQRICAPEYFDRFFSYGIPLGDLPDADFKVFVDRLADADALQATTGLQDLIASSSAETVIQKLRTVEAQMAPPGAARTLALAVAASSDVLPDPGAGPLDRVMTPFTQAAMHVASLLRQLPAAERRGLVEQVIDSTPFLPFASEGLRWAYVLSGEDVAEEEKALSSDDVASLQEGLAQRIRAAADVAPLFLTLPKYAPSLYYDWLRGDEAGLREHLTASCTGNFDNSLALVRCFMPTARSMISGLPTGSLVHRNTYDSIAGLMDPQILVDSFASRFPSVVSESLPANAENLDEDERIALRFAQIDREV